VSHPTLFSRASGRTDRFDVFKPGSRRPHVLLKRVSAFFFPSSFPLVSARPKVPSPFSASHILLPVYSRSSGFFLSGLTHVFFTPRRIFSRLDYVSFRSRRTPSPFLFDFCVPCVFPFFVPARPSPLFFLTSPGGGRGLDLKR